ncbi:PAS domain-containing sensor histidine kinase [Chitinibacter bivalviorum]|uniref:histidine kinase n=1 Tax=Chitinibacter bivalviorum TaxID=2739434 RepID=A0A7H9BM91_9NEIS|nr:PAS domain-containing sensor histidine kinase [Chitinibacter bivalviorum]QLG89675.1 PAS domain-containing sensor histidine kinase [Chitinibacter bivalviorum]
MTILVIFPKFVLSLFVNVKPLTLLLMAWLGLLFAAMLAGSYWLIDLQHAAMAKAGTMAPHFEMNAAHLSSDLLGIFVLILFFLLFSSIPLWVLLAVQKKQQQQATRLLPELPQLEPAKIEALGSTFAPVLHAMQALQQQQAQEMAQLSERNEMFANALDELNDMGRQLRRSELRWALALEATGDGIWEWDADDNSWYFSQRCKSILGYLDQELASSFDAFRQLIHPDDAERVANHFAQYVQVRPKGSYDIFELEFRMQHKEGHWLQILSRAVASRDLEGHVVRIVGTHSDITEQRKTIQDLSNAKEAAEKAVSQLRNAQMQMIESEKLAALGALVAGVAHEVNTPLGIALTAASTLNGDTETVLDLVHAGSLKKSELQHYLEIAHDATGLILRHCDNAARLIRSFKNISVDQTAEVIREFDLGLYLQEILQSLRPSLRQTTHTITLDCPEGLMVHTYPSAFTQIFNNLVNNAILHAFVAGQHGVMQIKVQILSDVLVEMRFMDNGIGIAESVRAKVFEPFYTTKRGQGGSGLGMSIVHNLVVAQLKGVISIEETPGGGASFVIVFPRAL